MVVSPDAYREKAGFRRSIATRLQPRAQLSGPITAYESFDLTDPALLEMMRAGRAGVTGLTVNEKQAIRNSTLFRAVSLISGSLGMLPIHLMRRKDDGTTEKAKDHPLYKVLHRRANDYQTAGQFKSYMQTAALFDGNAFALKVRSRGAVRQIIPLPRGRVTPELTSDFTVRFKYDRPQGGTTYLSQQEVFHFRAPVTLDGLNGVKLVDIAADTLGLSLKAQRALSRLLTKGTMARGSLETDSELGEEAINNLKQSLRDDFAGADAEDDWLVLEEGLKAKLFASTARDSQLHEMMQHEAEEISRFTGVPRPLLSFDETSWGSGIEQLGLFFVTYCLLPWFVQWEEAIGAALLTDEERGRYTVKFNEAALLRGSLKDQAEFLSKALGGPGAGGYMLPDEARDKFDMNPLDDGLGQVPAWQQDNSNAEST